MAKKHVTRVAVLMGGPSSEHDVSINTGKNICRAINKKKFEAFPLILSKKLTLSLNGKSLKFPDDLKQFDIVFNALHGIFGEDGILQTILDKHHIPYTGSGATSSKLGMDKWESMRIFKKHSLHIPRTQLLTKKSNKISLHPPLVLKPRNGGSSIGIVIVKEKKDIPRDLAKAFRHENNIIAQEYIRGKELTCPVLEHNGKLIALPVIEIRPHTKYEFFDYEAKYKPGASEEIVPAPILPMLAKKIQRASLVAHRALGCRVYSRSDFIWSGKKLYILEINTLPGLTQSSLTPRAAKAAGISFQKLVETIITASLQYYKKN